jgi:type I restriction enzyme, S subunit
MSDRLPRHRRVPLDALAAVDPETLPASTSGKFSFKYIDISAATEGKLAIPSSSVEYCDAPSRARRVLRSGDVIMSTVRPNLKAFAYCRLDSSPHIASTGFAVLRAKENVVPYFLLCSLLSDDVSSQINRLAVGSNYPAINSSDVRRLLLPDFSEQKQKRIAAILTSIDRVIEKSEALIAKYEQIKAGLMHDLFTRGVLPNGQLRPPREQAPELYQESAIGWLPIHWDAVPLGQMASFQRGHDIIENQFEEGPFPVVSSSGVIGFHSAATSVGPNVVVGRKGTIGKVHFLRGSFWAHDTSLYVTNFFGNNKRFIFHLCRYLDLARFGTKSGSPSLNRNDIHPLLVARPTASEQIQIVSRIDTVLLRIDAEHAQLRKLQKQKLGLMQDLLTGKVPVNVTEPTPEPVNA